MVQFVPIFLEFSSFVGVRKFINFLCNLFFSQMLTVSSVSHSPLSADYISGLQGFALLGPVRKD